jgi:hypothetical protein
MDRIFKLSVHSTAIHHRFLYFPLSRNKVQESLSRVRAAQIQQPTQFQTSAVDHFVVRVRLFRSLSLRCPNLSRLQVDLGLMGV